VLVVLGPTGDSRTGRLLAGQFRGNFGSEIAKRVVATAIHCGLSVDQIATSTDVHGTIGVTVGCRPGRCAGVGELILADFGWSGGREEVGKQLGDAFVLVVVDPVRGVG
jgi:hypothetical protein